MTAPVIRQFLGTIPDKGQAQTAFDTNVDAFLDWQALQFAPDLVAFGTFAQTTANALLAGNLPPLTGQALKAVRVNATDDGIEMQTVTAQGWTFLAAADAAAQRTALEISAPVELTQAQVENDASEVFGQVSGQRLAQAVVAGAVAPYNSGDQTITSGGALTLAHGLGARPDGVTVFLRCVTAQHGYSVNDHLIVNPATNTVASGGRGLSLVADATNLLIRTGDETITFEALNKTTGVRALLTNANWRYVFVAFKF